MARIFITGGAQGIGKGVARQLLDSGHRVVLADVDDEALAETVAEFEGLGELYGVQLDVADEVSVEHGVAAALDRLNGFDVLINNAGIATPYNPSFVELTLAQWNRMLTTNLTSVFLVSKMVLPHLRQPGGVIINIGSTRALQSEPHTEAYTAAKGGVVALTHAMAMSLGPGVRVNCISPGWIDVRGLKKQRCRQETALSERDHAQHPAGRVGTSADVAAMVEYLISPAAGFVTGQNLVVDGGMTRKMIYEE